MLSEEEKYRYNRHLILDKVGLEGQQKLKNASVLVIGAGGLGCPILQYLTAAGVGNIGIIDFDEIDETNLQRQVLFTLNDIGKKKAGIAAERLSKLNSFVKFEVYPERLTTKNALELFNRYDLIIDGTDNFSTRYLVNDACVLSNKPLVYGSIFKFEGQVSVFNYKNGPSYRCLFPEPPKSGSVPNCSEIGVIGVLPGIIGTQQANEAIKIILEIGTVLSGQLLIYNALDASQLKIKIYRNEKEIEKVLDMKDTFVDFNYNLFCGIEKDNSGNDIDADLFKTLLNNDAYQIIDVREEYELPRIDASNVNVFPLDEIEAHIDQISRDKKVIIICQSGMRSRHAIEILNAEYGFDNLLNLDGGVKSL